MSLEQALLHPRMLGALLAYALLSVVLSLLTGRVHARAGHGPMAWLWEHVYSPMLRAGLLVGFLLLSYPVLYGITEAPPLAELLFGGRGRLSFLVGLVFVLSLLLPLAPVIGAQPGLMLPVQGISATALMFGWLATEAGAAPVSYLPGWGAAALIVLVSVIAYWAASRATALVGHAGRELLRVDDADAVAGQSVVLVLQIPAVLIYSLDLGGQLT